MQIGDKHDYGGAFYSIPEANEKFAKSGDIQSIKSDVESANDEIVKLKGKDDYLVDRLEVIDGDLTHLMQKFPEPTDSDIGKAVVVGEDDTFEYREVGESAIVITPIFDGTYFVIDSYTSEELLELYKTTTNDVVLNIIGDNAVLKPSLTLVQIINGEYTFNFSNTISFYGGINDNPSTH